MNTRLTWLEISASAFAKNCAYYASRMPGASCALVIKSNAYGHGLPELSTLAQKSNHVSWLCTSNLSEALAVRASGVTKPLLVLSYCDADPILALTHDIALTVSSSEQLTTLSALQHPGVFNVHLKVDTGMRRFGFAPDEVIAIAQQITATPNLNLSGIYTHFAESDNADQTFTDHQHTQFATTLTQLHAHGITPPCIHAHNSAASRARQPFGTLSRIGAGAYGLLGLTPVLTWKARIISLRTVGAQQPIGYSRTYTTQRETRVASIPVGYYEGYDRRLSNCGTVVIMHNGTPHYAPVIGRVCMNVTLLDVTDIPDAQIGTEVIILGDHDDIRAADLAHKVGSFNPREITTRIAPHLPRIIMP